MKRPDILIPYSFLLMAAFFSCTVYEPIPIEVIRTRDVPLQVEGNQVALMYRNFKYPGDTLQHYYRDGGHLRKDKKNLNHNIDSIAVSSCLQSAAQKFAEYGVTAVPVIYPVDFMPGITGEKIPALPATLVRKIILPSRADYLVSLETLSYFYSRFPGDSRESELRQVVMAGLWAVYDGHSGEVADSRQMVDTLYWNEADEAVAAGKSPLPPRLPAIRLAAEVFGENYAGKFHSDWIEVDRMLIVPPLEEFRIAANYVQEQKWDQAIEIWRRYTPGHMGKLAITARYNLALAAEINDNLEEANNQINSAYDLASVYRNKNEMKMVLLYREILQKRQKEIDAIETPGLQ